MIVETFHPRHMLELAPRLQPAQRDEYAGLEPCYFEALAAAGPAMTMRRADGAVILCCGIAEVDGQSHLWSFIAGDAGRHMVAILRVGQRMLEIARRPVVATARFPEGCRLLEMLGLRFTRFEEGERVYVLEAS